MKPIFFTLSVIAILASSLTARAQLYIFKVGASIPATMDVIGASSFVIKKTLKTDDLINLALGRPLSTKVDSKTEILALATTFESQSTTTPSSQLVIFNPSETGTAQITTTVATLSDLNWSDFGTGSLNSGQGIASGEFLTTTLGTPALNGFVQSTFTGAGICSGPHIKYKFTNEGAIPEKVSPVASASFVSQLQFNYTVDNKTTNFNGFVTKGVLTLSGNAIGAVDVDTPQ